MIKKVFDSIPTQAQPAAKLLYDTTVGASSSVYSAIHPRKTPSRIVRSEFVETCFASPAEYQQYKREFFDGPAATYLDQARSEYRQLGTDGSFGGIPLEDGVSLYALVRKYRPEVIVETGVCNGTSTLFFLLALRENDFGTLHSLDYPYRASEPLDEFRKETFDAYGGAAIPADKDPGWILPDELRDRWELTVGKSQLQLPGLLDTLGEIDMFVHDSEHSEPCMIMEYELAFARLTDGGWLLSDDIHWNDAWQTFLDVREPRLQGKISPGIGFVRR